MGRDHTKQATSESVLDGAVWRDDPAGYQGRLVGAGAATRFTQGPAQRDQAVFLRQRRMHLGKHLEISEVPKGSRTRLARPIATRTLLAIEELPR